MAYGLYPYVVTVCVTLATYGYTYVTDCYTYGLTSLRLFTPKCMILLPFPKLASGVQYYTCRQPINANAGCDNRIKV